MGGGDLHPGPQSKSMIFPKNHLFPRHFKGWTYESTEPIVYSMTSLARHANKWKRSYAVAGVAAFFGITFFCEWRWILRRVPLINWPYEKQE